MPIIKSLLDNDFYKFTMMQAIYHRYTDVWVKYRFKWRNWDQVHSLGISPKKIASQLRVELSNFCDLRFSEDELEYLNSIPFIKRDFVEFLRLFKLNRDHISVTDDLGIEVYGPWLNTILFETPVLAMVSELYTKQFDDKESIARSFRTGLDNKDSYLDRNAPEGFHFGDFGARRRLSFETQDAMIEYFLGNKRPLIGTSNTFFAKKYNIKPLGTQAHEWFQVHQQLNVRLADSQKDALQKWADEYRGDLGIALSDTMTFNCFLKDFDKYFAKLFDGVRHDSGSPYEWVERLIQHYKSLGIDPKTKTALFSDGLNFRTAIDLYNKYNPFIDTSFGIGTYLTNDSSLPAPNIVMKVVECNGLPVAKVSDSEGKGMCEDFEFESYLKKIIKQKCNK